MPEQWHHSANTYAEGCLAYGAHLLRRYDIAQRAMAYALRQQSRVSGGIYVDRPLRDVQTPQLLYPTAQVGMTALLLGRPAEARAAGEWLVRLWQAQPELPARLYTMWTDAGSLATSVPEGEERRNYIQESQETYEYHYNGGIAAACLASLYLATGEQRWLETARAYEQFSMQSTPRASLRPNRCARARGGTSLLWLATGEQQYLDWTVRMGDWFVAGQTADGHWFNTPYHVPNPTLDANLQITAEFVVHLDHIMAALGTALVG